MKYKDEISVTNNSTYEDFELLVGSRVDQGYPITVVQSPAGEASLYSTFDSTNHTLQYMLATLVEWDTNAGFLTNLGTVLFEILFVGDIGRLYHTSLNIVRAQGKRLRIRLNIQPPEFAVIPWEYVYDPEGEFFLATAMDTALVRYVSIPVPLRIQATKIKLPLRILVIISNPADLHQLNYAREKSLIEEALAEWITQGHVQIKILEHAIISEINQAIRSFLPHVFHFVGHGLVQDDIAYVVLEDENQLAHLVDEQIFRNFFTNADDTRLVVLNACQTATLSSSQPLGGLAPRLLQQRLPSVVAMQYPIRDTLALVFVREFYRSIALGYSLEAAISEARRGMFMDVSGAEPDWGIPVLFLRAKDGQIFEVEADILSEHSPDIQPIQTGDRTATASERGIAVSGDVGGNLVIDASETTINFPRLAKIALTLLAIGILLLVVFQSFDLYKGSLPPIPTPTPTVTPIPTMAGSFNVAIAPFNVVGTGDGLESADRLVLDFSNSIEITLSELENELGLIEFRPPAQMADVSGATADERASNAIALAENIGADVIIYGMIEVDGLSAILTPEFYINEVNDGLWQADEIIGQHEMGHPLVLDRINNRSERDKVAKALKDRFQSLAFIVDGLAAQVIGDYEKARRAFENSLKITAWDTPEVIYLLLGNATLKQHLLKEAAEYYQQAITINGKYSRAYLGVASVLYMQAQNNGGVGYDNIDIEFLDQAIDAYLQAIEPEMIQPPLAYIDVKANFGLGQAYFLKLLAALSQTQEEEFAYENLNLAYGSFQNIIDSYDYHRDYNDIRLSELAAHAHARIGLIYSFSQEWVLARDAYMQAIEIIPKLQRTKAERAKHKAALANIYLKLDEPTRAIQWYTEALADAPPDSDEAVRYKEKLDELQH